MKQALATVLLYGIAVVLTPSVLAMLFRIDALPELNVLFYRGLALSAISAGITFACLLAFRRWRRWRLPDAVSATVFAAAVSVCFFVIVPVTIDRSISVFLLNEMAADPSHRFTEEELQRIFVDRYVDEYGQIQRRLEEQRISGNVIKAAPGYKITDQGIAFMRFAALVSKIFGTDARFVNQHGS